MPEGLNRKVKWRAHPHVARTVAEDSFDGWEAAFVEAIKNSLDADADRVEIRVPVDALVEPKDAVVEIVDNGDGMSPDDLDSKFTLTGRPRRHLDGLNSARGRPLFARRGTGKIAYLAVAQRVRIETTSEGHTSELAFSPSEMLGPASNGDVETEIQVRPARQGERGTRVVLIGYHPESGTPPSLKLATKTLLSHFGHLDGIEFRINGAPFKPTDVAELLHEIGPVDLPGIGTATGQVWMATEKLDRPGLVVYSGGQRVHGPDLIGLDGKGYDGDAGRVVKRLLGRVQVDVPPDVPVNWAMWAMTPHFKAFADWLLPVLEGLVDAKTEKAAEDRVNSWLRDPKAKRLYEALDDHRKASAKRIFRNRARRIGKAGTSEQDKIIVRLVLRALKSQNLLVVLTALDDADDTTIDTLSEILGGADRWTLEQVAIAASLVKTRMKALEELEAAVADYDNREDVVQRILERHPWIIADDFQSYASNQQIRTTLRERFDLDVDDPQAVKRPDFFFVLGDEHTTTDTRDGSYLIVEIKGPKQPLESSLQHQATDYWRTFKKYRHGRAVVVLLGVEYSPTKNHPDRDIPADDYRFISMTYEQAIAKCRKRLGYLSAATSDAVHDLDKIVAELSEKSIESLMD